MPLYWCSTSDSATYTDNQESDGRSTKYTSLPRAASTNFATPGIFTIWVRQYEHDFRAEVTALVDAGIDMTDNDGRPAKH